MEKFRLLIPLIGVVILGNSMGIGYLTLSSSTAFLLFPTSVVADEIPPELMETLKKIPIPHMKIFIKFHGELLEHNLDLAPRCFECHKDKRLFCVGCHAIAYAAEETGETDEEESEDWDRLGIVLKDLEEDLEIFKRLGIPLNLPKKE